MQDGEETKRALAASLKRLMSERPLAKVSVLEVARDCGISRKSFYYHFPDKYALFEWIYRTEAIESVADFSDGARWKEGVSRIFAYLERNGSFYRSALAEQGPDPFSGYLFEAIVALDLKVAAEFSAGLGVPEAEKLFIAEFFACAYVSVAVRWIKTGMRESAAEMSERIADIVDGSMRRALERHASTKERRLLSTPRSS